jgi:YhfC intramembrane metalloprotease
MSGKDLWPLFASGFGMMLVAVVAVLSWWRIARVHARWYWVGAGLWTVAVVLKILCALLCNKVVMGVLKELPHPLFVAIGGLYVGVQSSVFEMGIALLAVLIWPQLGRNANRAITIGLGAGAFEAFLLGIGPLAAAVFLMLNTGPEGQKAAEELGKVAAATPLYWLAGTVERIIAILCHASTRALVILGVCKRKYTLVLLGFLIFTLLDGVAGVVHVAGLVGQISMWWIELAILPIAIASVPILAWCYRRWPEETGQAAVAETT